MELHLDRLRQNVEKADTEDLLDRATVYRQEMEPDALRVIEAELAMRDVSVDSIEEHLQLREGYLMREDGTVMVCGFCHRPAMTAVPEWHRIFGYVPLFRRTVARCGWHALEAR